MTEHLPNSRTAAYRPALAFKALNPAYDLVARLTVRDVAHKRALIRQADVRPGERVLDAGCGTGTLAMLLRRQQPDCDITGLDADPDMLSHARRKAARAGASIRFVRGYVQEQNFRAESFDCVLSSLLFHHLDRDTKLATLLELHRVLRCGGRLHVVDWGTPTNPVLAIAFLLVRTLDGFRVTEDNAKGRLPLLLNLAGFSSVLSRGKMSTPLGTLDFLSAVKTDVPSGRKDRTVGAIEACT